jgi:hypothetical protein
MGHAVDKIFGVKIGADPTSDKEHELGLVVLDQNGNEWTYVRAGAALTIAWAVKIDFAEGYWDVTPTTEVKEPIFGIVDKTFTDNYYGFILTKGVGIALVASGVTAGMPLVSTTTDGVLDTQAVTSGPTQAEGQSILAAACGKGVYALQDRQTDRSYVRIA